MHVQVHREADHEFGAVADGYPSYLRYVSKDRSSLDLVSTFVHREVRGRGVGEKLVLAALDYARDESLTVGGTAPGLGCLPYGPAASSGARGEIDGSRQPGAG